MGLQGLLVQSKEADGLNLTSESVRTVNDDNSTKPMAKKTEVVATITQEE